MRSIRLGGCPRTTTRRSLPLLLQLVMFHGCYHDASGSWPYDPNHCPECLGLPEEVAHVKVGADDASRAVGNVVWWRGKAMGSGCAAAASTMNCALHRASHGRQGRKLCKAR